jgi:hypothetical protein
LGRVRIKIDGQVQAELDLHASDNIPASSVFEQEGMADGGHTLVIETVTGRLATGVLEVTGSRE